MEPKEKTDIHPQPQNSPRINQNLEAEENTDAHTQPQKSPDDIHEVLISLHSLEELVLTAVQEENGDASIVKIPQMEAICEICYTLLQEDTSATLLKTKCKCEFSLIHQQCCDLKNPEKKENAKCDVCGQVIQYIPVTLTRPKAKVTEARSSHKRVGSGLLKKFLGNKDG